MIRLIASDLDGTLLPEGTPHINPAIYDVIRGLQSRGITFVVASGRNYGSIMSLFGEMETELTVISDNGGYIASAGKTMCCNGFSRELFTELVEKCRRMPGIWMMASGARQVYTDQTDEDCIRWIRTGYKSDIQIVEDLLKVEEPLIKIAIYTYDVDAAVVAEPLQKEYGDRASIAVSGERWVDMMVDGVNKGMALAKIQEKLGITPAQTVAFGDNGNDIPMLELAEESYAVATARPEVKRMAKHVITDLSEDSVLYILQEMLKKY